MAKVTSIEPAERVCQRSPDAAFTELCLCTTDFHECLKELAQDYPGVIAIGSFACGKSQGALVISPSEGTWHMSPVAMQRVQALAWLITRLPDDLLQGFKLAFEHELIGMELARIEASRRAES